VFEAEIWVKSMYIVSHKNAAFFFTITLQNYVLL